jgi:hypothetical protein
MAAATGTANVPATPVGTAPAATNLPAWRRLHGPKRIQAEFKAMKKIVDDAKLPFVRSIEMRSDDVLTWKLELTNFDSDCAGGKDLNADLQTLSG